MAIEIERKFLLANDSWRQQTGSGTAFRQGYMTEQGPASVRVRIEGEQANINIKGATLAMQRDEYEYAIPLGEAMQMLERLCIKPIIEKFRLDQVNDALEHLKSGQARYRLVLTK